MAIWRGPGGPGDAVPDQANSAQLAENFANAAAASAASALTSQTNAAASAAAALVSESNASTSASQASSSESNAASSASAALASEQAAALSESNAASSESNAASSESNAASSESNAASSEANALASEQAAALSESNAASSESNAAASEAKAQQWATEAEDVPVETSPSNLYSAFHWAQKAEDFAQSINPANFVDLASAQTITGVKTFDNGLNTDTISEETAAAGVTIDGVLLKDSEVTTDVINEKTSATGVTIDGVLLKDSQVTTDQINEKTSAAGVTIDGVLLKDSAVSAPDGGTFTKTTATTNAVTQVLRVDSQSSGTPATGIGVGIEFATETAAGNTEIGATIEAITTDVTSTSEDFDLSFKTMAAGAAAAERMRVTSTGNLQFNSGYGSVATGYGCRAWVNFNGTSNSANLTGTYSQTGTTVTVSITAHGYITGNEAYLDFTSGTAVDGTYTVTVVDANTFTVTQASRTTSGNVTDRRNPIRASGNVSSITDNGTGDYTVNFTTAMPDANYSRTIGVGFGAGNFAPYTMSATTTALQVGCRNPTNQAAIDVADFNVAVHR